MKINQEFYKDLYEVSDHYGVVDQSIQAIEEMAELTKELTKQYRYGGKRSDIAEEIADVQLMLLQLMYLFDISEDEITANMKEKLNRQLGRMQDET